MFKSDPHSRLQSALAPKYYVSAPWRLAPTRMMARTPCNTLLYQMHGVLVEWLAVRQFIWFFIATTIRRYQILAVLPSVNFWELDI
jgi:hypothetical protein